MEKKDLTISKEELQQIIEDALYTSNCTQPNLEYNIITEKELSKRLSISKVTLHKYRKEGKIPFSKVGRTIRYDYKEVMETIKFKK
tara:strand:- start:31 stop:288 length:258 start_codon:yes stop_codon:yes gene_type:complete